MLSDKDLIFLKNLIKLAGIEVLKIYNSNFSYSLKSDKSPLTNADLISNKILIEGLKSKFSYPIISEELVDETVLIDKKIWVIDPLDGTSDFIKKTGEFSIMIALLKNSIPIFGMVYVPVSGKLYYAQKGCGSFLENFTGVVKKLKVSKISKLSNFILLKSRSHFSLIDEAISKKLNISKFKKMGSIGVKFGYIAEGKAEICYYTTNEMGIWDDAPAQIILKEAGGLVFSINGLEPIYDLNTKKMKNGFIGINGNCKSEILNILKNELN